MNKIYTSPGCRFPGKQLVLAVSFENGLIHLMNSYDDVLPVVVRTGESGRSRFTVRIYCLPVCSHGLLYVCPYADTRRYKVLTGTFPVICNMDKVFLPIGRLL